jgi:formate dehydrogenase major subunit
VIKIKINKQEFSVPKDYTILQACQENGIKVPTLCHDPRLEPGGACRMCVVELAHNNAIVTACTTPVSEGLEVLTESEEVVQIRKDVLDLMLANHPLDCLTCQDNGQCKLQEYCYLYDVKESSYTGEVKQFEIDDSNPFYISDQNKCINCGLCVRVCDELQQTKAIGFAERGFKTHISPSFDFNLDQSTCVSCGNCVAVCPSGALTPKIDNKFRYWETKRVRTTCGYCGVGCQLDLLIKDNKVVDVQPANGPSNDGLLCVKGRFSYHFLSHEDRLKTPLIKENGQFREASWDEAYQLIANKINKIKSEDGPEAIGGFTSARCTNEDNYVFQKLFRADIGTNSVDHCARL